MFEARRQTATWHRDQRPADRPAQRNPRGDFSPQTLRDLGIDPAEARQRVLDELRGLTK